MKKATLSYLTLGGVMGPVLFTIVTLICSSFRPDYNHIAQFISELGATGTGNAAVMNWIGFIPSGLMITGFGLSLIVLLPKTPIARIGSVLIIVFGLGMTVAGNFSCDIGCPREGSLENLIHDKISGLIFILVVIGILLLGISFRSYIPMQGLWRYSVLSAMLSLFFLMGLITSIEAYTTTGLWQRLFLGTVFLWCGIVGCKMFKSSLGADVV